MVVAPNVYPNPATDLLNVEVPNPGNDVMKYELYDATGRVIMSVNLSGTRNSIDMSKYEEGIYTLRITNLTTSEVIVKPIVKS